MEQVRRPAKIDYSLKLSGKKLKNTEKKSIVISKTSLLVSYSLNLQVVISCKLFETNHLVYKCILLILRNQFQ